LKVIFNILSILLVLVSSSSLAYGTVIKNTVKRLDHSIKKNDTDQLASIYNIKLTAEIGISQSIAISQLKSVPVLTDNLSSYPSLVPCSRSLITCDAAIAIACWHKKFLTNKYIREILFPFHYFW
jgi:hypothetical protein